MSHSPQAMSPSMPPVPPLTSRWGVEPAIDALAPDRLAQLDQAYRQGLLADTVPFWLQRCQGYLDRKHGGYCHMVDHDGSLIDTDKSIWAQGRNLWLWATLHRTVQPRDDWREAADLGARFLDDHGFDPADGRMWFHVAQDGTPLRKRRYAFSESFAAIGYAAYAAITGQDRYARKAIACFDAFRRHQPAPKFTTARPAMAMGGPMITLTTAQTLRETIGYDASTDIDQAIATIERHFVKDDLRVVMEQVAPDGSVIDHIDGRTLNPGHAIEGAWFILEESIHRGGDAHLTALGCRMLDYMWPRGWDATHGGLLYFVDLHGRPVQEYWHSMKFWWPQNEAIIATLMAYTLTGEPRYARWHTMAHDWAHQHHADPHHGEWFGYLHQDGRPAATTKGNLWKSPFHHPRMQWRCMKLTEQLLAGKTQG